jgi:hypothetical protein
MKLKKAKGKLQKFTLFANNLFPHEVSFLISNQHLIDAGNLQILQKIEQNSSLRIKVPYNTSIDKRKYSYLMLWIQKKLQAIDVDVYYDRLCDLDRKIMTDTISSVEEKAIIEEIKKFERP